ncbi:cytochrome P-450 [Rhexocercosporidium sp. MPI-PUGE-AT-0058]|nr:cytochrome P-450 [Rhexocercosporidium sp. MPI-PUGE-AT-0058]
MIFENFLLFLCCGFLLLFLRSNKGCGIVPTEQTRWPLGIDKVRVGLQADRDQRTPEFVTERFENMGRYTFRISILGSTNLITAEPANVQAILASQFTDFAMGATRKTNLKLVLGRSIFAVDGKAWHSAREVVRPIFARENIADLSLLENHVQKLFACVEGSGVEAGEWTLPVSLGALFPCLTLDSATELFLGQSTHCLQAWRNAGGTAHSNGFQGAFEKLLALLSIRMRLRGLYWLYGNRELKVCMAAMHNFVDDAIRTADEAKLDGSAKSKKHDFLYMLRSTCADQAEVREQVLGLLAAGRDTTASLMSWVFYCLARDDRVWKKLRAEVINTFGAYSSDTETTLQDVTFQKLKSCRYLQYVLNETLRLHSIVAFNSRMAVRDTTIPTGGGADGTQPVFVPAGTEVNFSSHVMHRRKDLWGDDADTFVPERWETARPRWSYVPFNGGPRLCIGQQFALTEAGYVIVRLLQRFDNMEGLDVDKKRDYTHFTVVASPGTPNHAHGSVRCRFRASSTT